MEICFPFRFSVIIVVAVIYMYIYILGNEGIAETLLRNGANANAIERDGSTAIHRAALRGMLNEIEIRKKVDGWLVVLA